MTERYVIRWQNPPPARNNGVNAGRPPGSEWNEVAAELRSMPNTWGVIYEGDRKGGGWAKTKVVSGRTLCFRPAGAFEACMRSVGGRHLVFARYVGR